MKLTLIFLLMYTALPPTTPAVSYDLSLSFEWTSPLSLRVRNRAGAEDDIDLRPANTMGDVTVDCLFTGFYVKDTGSSAGVVGCQDWEEVNIVTVSNMSTGTMFTLFNRNKTTVELLYTSPFKDDFVEEEHQRPKRSDYYDELEKEYVDDDIEYDMATLPPNLYYEFRLAFDDALLTVMNENKTAAEEYVTAVATLAQTFFKKASLGTNIHFVIKNKPRHLQGKEFQINPNAPGGKLKIKDTYTIDSSEALIIFTATDETELWRGVAPRRGACSKTKARALLKHRKEIQKAALTMAHEMGHLYGKYHDASSREDPKCVGKGIMTDTPTNRPEEWSSCSRERLIKWFMRPDNKASTCLKTAPPCNNDAWSQNVPCSCGEDVRTNLCTSQDDGYCELSTATCKGEPLASDIASLNAIIQNMKLEMDTLRQIIIENTAETTNLKNCLADASSPDCPRSAPGSTGLSDRITENTAATQKLENCLSDASSPDCPPPAPGKTGILARITENTAETTNIKTCLADTSSSLCPLSAHGKTGITSNAASLTNIRSCLADTSSNHCPSSTLGKSGITTNSAAITNIRSCLADTSSGHCPSSAHAKSGITAIAAALATKCDVTTCSAIQTEATNLEGKVAILERKSSYCAYRTRWKADSREITYNIITLNDNNIPGANFNKKTGRFTAGVAGTYLIQVSMRMVSKSGNYNQIYIRKNNSEYLAAINSDISTSTSSHESGGKSMMLHLNTGDTVSLYSSRAYDIYEITFCIALS